MTLDATEEELRVAFSRDAQPVWFRVAKWVIFLTVSRRLHGTRWFRIWLSGGLTRPWGGWDDVK